MAITQLKRRQFKPAKTLKTEWDSFRRGLNTTLRDNELGDEQVKELQNLILDGKGLATPRPGTDIYFNTGTSGKVRGMFGSKIDLVNELLAISDMGYLVKKSGTSNSRINGYSWPSGEKIRMIQLQDKVYLTQTNRPLVKYDGYTLTSYTTILAPVSLTVTNLSGVSGTFTWSWRIAFTTDAGRSAVSDPVLLANLPEDLTRTSVRITWGYPSNTTPYITGVEVYGREQGAESRLTGLANNTNSWIDDGSTLASNIAFMPEFNESGGPNAKYIIKSAGKIVLANIVGATSRIMWSGADVNIGKFHWTRGGGYIDISKDDGQAITGIKEVAENLIVVWKERSIYQVKLSYNSDLGIVEATYTKISDAVGGLSHDTIQAVENDTYFVGLRPGGGVSLNSLGYQSGILAAVLRTAETSAAIRPDLKGINRARRDDMWAIFYDQRYWWFYPIGTSEMKCLVYDYERQGFSGPMSFPDNPIVGAVYYDDTNRDRFLYGDGDDGDITEISATYKDDKGVDFNWRFGTKKEDFGVPDRLKTLLNSFVHIADLTGNPVQVQIYAEDKEGNTTPIKTYDITPSAINKHTGWGSHAFGSFAWGSTIQSSPSTSSSRDYRKTVQHNKSQLGAVQVVLSGTGANCKIVQINLEARPEYGVPSDWLVT